jgi:hypothetical protein
MGTPKESLEKKNIFAEKYDEIKRLDGTTFTYFEKSSSFRIMFLCLPRPSSTCILF